MRQNSQEPNVVGETAVITRAQNGEESAFEELFHTYKKRVYHLCLRMIGNIAEAEELTQEVFLRAFRKINSFRAESAFATWLHRLSVNTVLMKLRKKRPKEISMEQEGEETNCGRALEQFAAPDLSLSGVIDRLPLEAAIPKLAVPYRRAFVLHDVLGYQHHEIASMLGCSVSNSKSLLHRARLRLRRMLQGKWDSRKLRSSEEHRKTSMGGTQNSCPL